MRDPGAILLVSCYESGHQPIAVASAAAFLERAGFAPALLDLSVEKPSQEVLSRTSFVAVSVPMHTALRLGVRFARGVRATFPAAHFCFFGLYATLNAEHLLEAGVADSIVGGEFEGPLLALVASLDAGTALAGISGVRLRGGHAPPFLRRLTFPIPSRGALPGLDRYARLEVDGESRIVAAVEASRGCLHSCRHCPIPPVYEGRFFVVPREVVLEDIRRLVTAGARHITFADPDFLNGPGHSLAIVRGMHAELEDVTFDFTTKVEHVLKHRTLLPELAELGCLFVVSAVESLCDGVLSLLAKGHTRRDVFEAQAVLRGAGITLRPTFVAFTPWTRLADYLDVLDWIDREGLVDQIDPVQLSVRLLVPPGSLLTSLPEMQPHIRGIEPENFAYIWVHPDPRMDALHRDVSRLVHEAALVNEDPARTFRRIRAVAMRACGDAGVLPELTCLPSALRARPPRLTEPWFC